MHGVDQAQPLADAALAQALLDLGGDVDELAPLRDVEQPVTLVDERMGGTPLSSGAGDEGGADGFDLPGGALRGPPQLRGHQAGRLPAGRPRRGSPRPPSRCAGRRRRRGSGPSPSATACTTSAPSARLPGRGASRAGRSLSARSSSHSQEWVPWACTSRRTTSSPSVTPCIPQRPRREIVEPLQVAAGEGQPVGLATRGKKRPQPAGDGAHGTHRQVAGGGVLHPDERQEPFQPVTAVVDQQIALGQVHPRRPGLGGRRHDAAVPEDHLGGRSSAASGQPALMPSTISRTSAALVSRVSGSWRQV